MASLNRKWQTHMARSNGDMAIVNPEEFWTRQVSHSHATLTLGRGSTDNGRQ
jgi:hypothetical protein